MPATPSLRWLLAAFALVAVAADDPDAGTEQRYRGMISSSQISCVSATDHYCGFGCSTGAVAFHKQQKQAITFHGFPAHRGSVLALAANPEATVLATAGADGAIHLWRVEAIDQFNTESDKFAQDSKGRKPTDPKPIMSLTGHTGPAHFITFDKEGDRLASAGADGTVRIWDTTTGKALKVLRGHRGAVKGVAFHPEGKRVVSAGADKSVRVWDLATGKEVKAITNVGAPLECVAYSSDGELIAAGGGVSGKSGLLKLFTAATGKEAMPLAGHEDVVTDVAFHPSRPRLVSVSRDKTIKTWDQATGKLLFRDKHREPVLRLSFSPDGTILGTASHEVVKFWHADTEPPGKQ